MVELRDMFRKLLRQVEPTAGNINQVAMKFHERTNHDPGAIIEETQFALEQMKAEQKKIIDLVYTLERAIPSKA